GRQQVRQIVGDRPGARRRAAVLVLGLVLVLIDAGAVAAAARTGGGALGLAAAEEAEAPGADHQGDDGDHGQADAEHGRVAGGRLLLRPLVVGALGRLALGRGLGRLFLVPLGRRRVLVVGRFVVGFLDDKPILTLGAVDLAADQFGVADRHQRLAAVALN